MKLPIAILAVLLLYGCRSFEPKPAIVEWRVLPEARMLSFDEVWQIVVAKITENFDLDTIDSKVGYLSTTHKYIKGDIALRITVKTDSREPVRIKIKVEKNRFNRRTGTWEVIARDTQLERQILDELSGRIR